MTGCRGELHQQSPGQPHQTEADLLQFIREYRPTVTERRRLLSWSLTKNYARILGVFLALLMISRPAKERQGVLERVVAEADSPGRLATSTLIRLNCNKHKH
ncbi:uncharacterized protein V6R79_022884 [Siganus canaliculatus]